jgi:hypothetical protein
MIELLVGKCGLSGPLNRRKMREGARYFRFLRRESRNRGLRGGEKVDTNSRAPFPDQDVTPAKAARGSNPGHRSDSNG